MVTTDKDLKNKHNGPLIATCVGIVLVVGGFAFWQARPLYRWVKTQRAIQMVDEIDAYREQGNVVEAHKIAFEAYHLAPNEPEILRVSARLAMAVKSPEARFFLDKLVEMGEANFEDRVNLLEALFGLREMDRVDNLADKLFQENPRDLRLLKLLAQILEFEEKPLQAMHVLEKIVALDPQDAKHRLRFARLLILHGNASDRGKGWKYVWKVAQDDGEYGIAAIELLLMGTGFPRELNAGLVERIGAHPLAEERHDVAALEIKALLHPEERSQIIADAIAHRADWPADDLGAFYRWLSTSKEHAVILQNLTLEKAKENQQLLVVYLNAMGNEGQWAEVRDHLADPSLPLSEPTQLMFSALCAQKLGEDETIIEEFLQKSVNTAARHGSYNQAFNTATYAEAAGLPEVAEMAYRLSLRADAVAAPAYEGLQRLATAEGDTLKLRNVTADYHYRFPRRPEIVERFLYLNALIGIEVESTLEKSLTLVEEEPYRIAPRITAALAYFRMGDYSNAAETCQPCNVEDMSVSQKVVYAAIAGAASKPELARQIATEVNENDLLQEEKMLLAPWIAL